MSHWTFPPGFRGLGADQQSPLTADFDAARAAAQWVVPGAPAPLVVVPPAQPFPKALGIGVAAVGVGVALVALKSLFGGGGDS